MKVSECDVDACEVCGEPLRDNEFRVGWDGPVCFQCEPPPKHSASDDEWRQFRAIAGRE